MLKCYLCLTLIFLSVPNLPGQDSLGRTIEVIGYAQVDVLPDEIYYSVTLSDKREGRDLILLQSIKVHFEDALNDMGIDAERIKVVNTDSRKFQYRRKRDEVHQSITYEVQFSNIDELDRFAARIKDIDIESAGIVRVDHSELQRIESDLKVAALKNAKNRAELLLAAVGETTGQVLEITEVGESGFREYLERSYFYFSDLSHKLQRSELSPYSRVENIEFKLVRLVTTIKAKFSIQ